MTVKDDIKAMLAEQPGLSVSEIANCLARDPRNTRRDITDLKGRGELASRKDERGVDRYYLAAPVQEYAVDHHRLERRHSEPQVIDDVTESAPGRTLVVAGQPYDSRTDAALRRHAAAKARAQRVSQGHRIGGQIVTSLNSLFEIDPTGDFTLTAMERAEVAAERERLAQEREAASGAIAAQPREPTMGELVGAAIRSLWEPSRPINPLRGCKPRFARRCGNRRR